MGRKPISVLITDTHLDDENFKIVYSVHEQAIQLAKSLGLNKVDHLGDHFDSRIAQTLLTLLNFKKIIRLYRDNGMILDAIAGNHDKTDQSIPESYIDIYTCKTFRNMDGKIIPINDDIEIHYLSYYEEGVYQKRLKKLIKEGDEDKKQLLFTHFGIDGVLNNDDRAVESSIKANSFKNYKGVFIGHYHNESDPSSSVHYIGSTDPRNYGENAKKGATVIYDDCTFEKVKFNFKGYKKIVIDEFNFKDMNELIQTYKDEEFNIKLEFVGSRDSLIKVDKKKLNEAGIEVNTVDTTLIKIEGGVNDGSTTINMERKDILKHLDGYSKENNIPRKKVASVIKLF